MPTRLTILQKGLNSISNPFFMVQCSLPTLYQMILTSQNAYYVDESGSLI